MDFVVWSSTSRVQNTALQVRNTTYDFGTPHHESGTPHLESGTPHLERNPALVSSKEAKSVTTLAASMRSRCTSSGPPMAPGLGQRASQEAEVLREPPSRDLSPVRGTLEPYAEEMKTKIQQRSSSNRSCRARWGPRS
ncbi:unnamed protein product [Boreogadus saida]